jgi:hypothetical protein
MPSRWSLNLDKVRLEKLILREKQLNGLKRGMTRSGVQSLTALSENLIRQDVQDFRHLNASAKLE